MGKITKGEFWRKLQDGFMLDYLKQMLCPVTTTTSMTKAFKKENRVPLWSVTVVWSLEFIIRH